MMDQLYAQQGIKSVREIPTAAQAVTASTNRNPLPDKFTQNPASDHNFANQLSAFSSPQEDALLPLNEQQAIEGVTEEKPEFGFLDFLDIINPLQHIPVISSIYREITGDEIQAPARIFGGMMYGGPLGFVSAIANVMTEETTGKDIGENIIASLIGDDTQTPSPQVASAQTTSLAADPSLPETRLTGAEALIFTQLAAVVPPPPVPLTGTNPANPKIPGSNNSEKLEGKAALSALFHDLSGQSPSPETEDSVAPQIALNTTPPLQNSVGKPGKWFSLTSGNVVVAPQIQPYSWKSSGAGSAPPPPTKPVANETDMTQFLPQPKKPTVAETARISTEAQSDIAQSILQGLDKYQEMKSQ
ncbi:hypothetical protein O4H49_10255 [Kiloniella laminariae]|uniref:Uncharacterized protein n=1 Tax=Kiloniella laminariae TaxID=454162 RepID=A0ABT4LJM5_9PROT|nr:hypothetical protein [Kiloniella laminariae]MCZ4281160.1 hypothetical protein [Kiloniella laminariae]